MTDWDARFATRIKRVMPSDVRERMKLLGETTIIQLGGGIPDPRIFPTSEIARICAKILDASSLALQYAPSEGVPALREWLCRALGENGVACGVENILITSGSQQGLDFIGKLFLNPGDAVAIESPTFIGALRAFDAYEPRYVPVGHDAKFAYVGTEFRNPTGTSLTLREREALLASSTAPLVEDSCYIDLRYEGDALPSLLALSGNAEQGRVIQTGTFSKTIAPALRVGWVVAPRAVIKRLALIKQASDLATGTLAQWIALEAADTILGASITAAREFYRRRRDAMFAALERHMPPGVEWSRPQGGFYVWVTLPEALDGREFAERALAECAVSVVAGTGFYPFEPRHNTIRLSFSLADEADAAEGIRRIATLIKV